MMDNVTPPLSRLQRTSLRERTVALLFSLLPRSVRRFVLRYLIPLIAGWSVITCTAGATIGSIWESIVQDYWDHVLRPWLEADAGLQFSRLGMIVTGGTTVLGAGIFIGIFAIQVQLLTQLRADNQSLNAQLRNLQITVFGIDDSANKDYTGTLLKSLKRWHDLHVIMERECADWDDAKRDDALRKFFECVVWDCAKMLGEGVVLGGSLAVLDTEKKDYLHITHTVGSARNDYATTYRFYVGSDKNCTDKPGIAGHAYNTRKLIIVNNVLTQELYLWLNNDQDNRPRQSVPYRAIAAHPLMIEGAKDTKPLGVLCLDGRYVDSFDEDFVKLALSHASTAIAEALQTCERERKRDA